MVYSWGAPSCINPLTVILLDYSHLVMLIEMRLLTTQVRPYGKAARKRPLGQNNQPHLWAGAAVKR